MNCRLCLKTAGADKLLLFETNSNSAHDIVKLITRYLRIEIIQHDTTFVTICQQCCDHLNEFHAFCTFVERQQETLRKLFSCTMDQSFENNQESEVLFKTLPSQGSPELQLKCEPEDHVMFTEAADLCRNDDDSLNESTFGSTMYFTRREHGRSRRACLLAPLGTVRPTSSPYWSSERRGSRVHSVDRGRERSRSADVLKLDALVEKVHSADTNRNSPALSSEVHRTFVGRRLDEPSPSAELKVESPPPAPRSFIAREDVCSRQTEAPRREARPLMAQAPRRDNTQPIPTPAPKYDRQIAARTRKHTRCPLCSEPHALRECRRFLGQTTTQRILTVQEHNMCSNCLACSHRLNQCSSKQSCRICRQQHHTLLH